MAAPRSRNARGTALRRAVAVLVALPFVAWAIVRTGGFATGGRVTLALSFTPYAALLSPLPVLVALALRRWAVAAVALVAAIALAVAVLPRGLGGSSARAETTPLTVMTLNLDDGRADAAAIARVVRERRVDVLAVVELKDALPRLRAAGLDRLLPRTRVSPYSRGGGSALLARERLPALARPKLGRYPEPAAATLRTRGRAVELIVVHPPHPTKPWFEEEWTTRLRELPSAGTGPLRVLLGDFNATLDHRQLRDVVARGYVDAGDATGKGLGTTWPAGRWPTITIDHVLVDRRATVVGYDVVDVPGTDHRAIVARLDLPQG